MTNGVVLREAEKRDLRVLTELMTVLGYPTAIEEMSRHLEEISAIPSYCTLVAEERAGSELRGRGVGQAQGGQRPHADDAQAPRRAHRFYQQMGCKATGYRFQKEL